MSLEEQKQWILKQPIVAESRFEGDQFMIVDVPEYDFEDDETEDCIAMTLEDFNSLFVELDVSGLTRQVEELIQTHDYVQAANQPMESNWDLEVTSFAEQIVLLLLNQEKETK